MGSGVHRPFDPRRIKSIDELRDYIESVGFLPFFNVGIEGFSLEGLTSADCWWTGNISEDPWMWREVIAREGEIAYGKLFRGKAGFISKMVPDFCGIPQGRI